LNHKLHWVACRSIGEQRTLLHLLEPKTRKRWGERIRVGPPALFQRDWWFVENVEASDQLVTVSLHSGSKPIDLSYERRLQRKLVTASTRLEPSQSRWAITARGPIDGVIAIRLDGHLAFQDRVVGTDMPF
jgi:hypothetical protein